VCATRARRPPQLKVALAEPVAGGESADAAAARAAACDALVALARAHVPGAREHERQPREVRWDRPSLDRDTTMTCEHERQPREVRWDRP